MKKLLPIIILVILTVGCSKRKSEVSDFNQLVYTPEYASGFSIKSADGYESSIITVTDPWQCADGITTQLFIARDGESAPEGFTGQVLEGDASRIVAMSSTHIVMLDAIGEAGSVVGVSKLFTLPVNAITALLGIPVVVWVVLRNKSVTANR